MCNQNEDYEYQKHYQTDAVYQSVASHIVEGCMRMIEQWRDNPPTHKV